MTEKKITDEQMSRFANAEGHITILLDIMQQVRMGLNQDAEREEDLIIELQSAIDSILSDFEFEEVPHIVEMVNYSRGVDENADIIRYWIDEGFLSSETFEEYASKV